MPAIGGEDDGDDQDIRDADRGNDAEEDHVDSEDDDERLTRKRRTNYIPLVLHSELRCR